MGCPSQLQSYEKLVKLKPNSAAGPDNLAPLFLRQVAKEIAHPLACMFEMFFSTAFVPPAWKMAYVKPIFKNGNASDASNYRPISLTCVCSKIMESIINENMLVYLLDNSLISEHQHGFLSRRSTCSQLLDSFQDWVVGLSNRKAVGFQDLRPISVTPILSRMVERVMVKKYLWPALDDQEMDDQFAFRPTGSTTAALVYLLHQVYTMFEQGNTYVRCLMIDYSKAFDVVDHPTLLNELATLDMRQSIYCWISDFLNGRTQAVKYRTMISDFRPITRSIVQGSVIGPTLYISLARKLKTLSMMNKIPKYADDTSLLVPQHTDCSMEDEFQHVQDWSAANKLTINTAKTKEIIFWRSARAQTVIPEMPGIERVAQAKLLGVILTSSLSWSAHTDSILIVATQRLYLLNRLKNMSLGIDGLNDVFRALVMSRLTYAVPAFSGGMTRADIDRFDALIRKARRWGVTNIDTTFEQATVMLETSLFSKIGVPHHCLHQLLPSPKPTASYNLRVRANNYDVPLIINDKLYNSFIYRYART